MATKSVLTLEIQSRLKKAVAELQAVETAIDEVGTSAENTGGDLDQLSSDFEGMAGAAKKTATVVTGAFVAATMAYSSFETQTVNVQNITEATDESMAALAGRIMELPPALGEADDLMAGLYQTISSGITDTEDAFGVIVASAKAAKGNLADMSQTVDAATSILNAYGLEAGEITPVLDAMTKTVDIGKLTFSDLANNIGKGISIAAAADVSYQELLATIATLTLNGLSTEEAMVAVKNILITGLKPTEQVSQAMKDLDVDMSAAALKAKGFGQWMADAAVAVNGNAEATAALFPNIRALTGVMQIATDKGGKQYSDGLDGISESLNKVAGNFERSSATIKGQTDAMTAEFKKLGIEFGELASEDAANLISGITGVITVLRDLDPEAQELLITSGKMALAWSGFILAAPKVIAGYKGITGALGLTSTAFNTARVSAGQVSLAFIAAGAVGLLLADQLDNLNQEFLKMGGEGSGSAANAAAEGIKSLAEAMKEAGGSSGDFAEAMGYSTSELLLNSEAILANLAHIENVYQAALKRGTATKKATAQSIERRKQIEKLEKVLKRAEAIEKKRLKALKDSEKQEKDNAETEEKRTEGLNKMTEAQEADLLALDKKVDANDGEQRALEGLIVAEGLFSTALENVAAELGLVAEESEGATVYLRGLEDVVMGAWSLTGLLGVSEAADDIALDAALAEAALVDMFTVAGEDIPPPAFADWRSEIDNVSRYFSDSLGFAVIDGLTEFDTFSDVFSGYVDEWSGMIKDTLGSAFAEAFSGGGSIKDFGSNLMAGIQDLGAAGVVGGLSMVYEATQMIDQTAATINGIIGGATAGAQAGGWVGAIIGGVLGGAAGYFGSGDDAPSTAIGINQGDVTRYGDQAGGITSSVSTRGQGGRELENQVLQSNLLTAYSDIKTGYLDILRLFGDESLFDLLGSLPEFFSGAVDEQMLDGVTFIEESADVLAEWLTGTWMPDAFEGMILDGLMAGLSNAGVSSIKVENLFEELSALSGDARAGGLESFILSIVNSRKLLEGLDFSSIIEAATIDGRTAFVDYMSGTVDQANLLFAGFGDLTTLEQADQANEIIDLIDSARQKEIQYLNQILQLSDDIERSIGSQIETLQLGGMNELDQADFIGGQVGGLFEAFGEGGLDPASIAQFTGDAQNYIGMLEGLFGEDIDLDLNAILDDIMGGQEWLENFEGMDVDMSGTGREFLISLLRALNGEAQGAISENVAEISALNEEYINILEMVNLELTTFAGALGDVVNLLGGPDGIRVNENFGEEPDGGFTNFDPDDPRNTDQGDGSDDDGETDPRDEQDYDPRDDGGKSARETDQIVTAINNLAVAISKMKAPQVILSENLSPLVRLIKSVSGNLGFTYQRQTS